MSLHVRFELLLPHHQFGDGCCCFGVLGLVLSFASGLLVTLLIIVFSTLLPQLWFVKIRVELPSYCCWSGALALALAAAAAVAALPTHGSLFSLFPIFPVFSLSLYSLSCLSLSLSLLSLSLSLSLPLPLSLSLLSLFSLSLSLSLSSLSLSLLFIRPVSLKVELIYLPFVHPLPLERTGHSNQEPLSC